MPTGYTAGIADGEGQTFEQFTLSCARGFGALIMMRDAPADAPIPDEFEPRTDWHDEAIEKAVAHLAELRSWDSEALLNAHMAARAEVLGYRATAAVERREKKQRYEAMLAEVRAWEPPTEDHQGLKDFMAQQIEESIRFDCSPITYPDLPTDDPADWLDEQMAKALRDIEYHTKERAEEVERARSRSAWVQALKASLSTAEVPHDA